MLISDFIKNSNVMNKFGSTLPIPYIENVLINDDHLKIYLSMYLHVPAVVYTQYLTDGTTSALRDFYSTLYDLDIVVATLVNRDASFVNSGMTRREVSTSENTQYSYPINAFSDVVSGNDSAIRYSSYQDNIEDKFFITTRFIATDLLNDRPDLLLEAHEELYEYNSLCGQPLVEQFLPNGEKMTGLGNKEYQEYIDSLVTEGRYETTTDAGIVLANQIISEQIQKNDYDIITNIFGRMYFGNFDDADTDDYHEVVPLKTGDLAGIDENIVLKQVLINPLLSTTSLDSDWSQNDIVENNDGSAYVKLTYNFTVDTDQIAGQVFGENFSSKTGLKDLGFVAYSAPNTLSTEENKLKIIETFDQNSGKRKVYETAISGINYVHFIKNGTINFDPLEIYLDQNEVFYDKAMQSIDGNYFDMSQVSPEAIVGDMQAIDTSALPADTINAFQYLLATSLSNPTEMIPQMNLFRRVFPEKSTATPIGQFYDKFAEILYNANTLLQQGTPLIKSLVTNPIIKDLRRNSVSSNYDAPHIYGNAVTIRENFYEVFSMDNALWGRYTEVTGKEDDDAYGTTRTISDEDAGSSTTYSGGQWNYNFIDHGYLFFNMERALKTCSFASQFLNIDLFEKYFGQKTTNSLFKMKKILFKSFYSTGHNYEEANGEVEPTAIMCAEIDSNMLTTKVEYETLEFGKGYQGLNRQKFDIFVDNDTSQATAGNGYVETSDGIRLLDDYGGANGMVNDREYSFISFRGFAPISIQQDANPLVVDEQFLTSEDMNYRLACFEIQKCDSFDAQDLRFEKAIDDTGAIAEIRDLGLGTAFESSLLVEDTTFQLLEYLYNIAVEVRDEFAQYKAAASDVCSFNEGTDSFNEYFVTTTKTNWPNQWSSPFFRAASIGVMLEDILFVTSNGDEISTLQAIDNAFLAISPETGTLNGIERFGDRLDTIVRHLEGIINSFSEYYIDGHKKGLIFGHDPSFNHDYDEQEGIFNGMCQNLTESKYVQGSDSGSSPLENRPYVFDSSYANYPVFPTVSVDTNERVEGEYTGPDVEAPIGTEDLDVTDDENTFIEQILEGISISNKRASTLLDIANHKFAEIQDRYGRGGLLDFTITPQDIFEEFYLDILTTFPDIENDIMHGLGTYDYLGQDAETMFDFLANVEALAPAFDTMMSNIVDLLSTDPGALVGSEISNFQFIAGNFAVTNTAASFLSTSNYINNKVSDTTIASLQAISSVVGAGSSAGRFAEVRGIF